MSELVDKKIPIEIFVLQPCKFQNNLEMAEEEKNSCLYDYMINYDYGKFLCENQLEGNMLTDHANVIHA